MLKSIVPALLIAGASLTAVQAADGASDKVLGFEFGVNYHLIEDRRFEGASTNFGLVLPIGQKFDVVIYGEDGRYFGKEDGQECEVESSAYEMRFRVTAWEGETQAVKVMLGIGYQDVNIDDDTDNGGAPIADLGIAFTVIKTKSGPVKGELGINAFYRYFRFQDMDTADLNEPVNKLGGFGIGVSAGLYF